MSALRGTSGLRWARLMPTTTMMPARVKRVPANSICEAVSPLATPNSA